MVSSRCCAASPAAVAAMETSASPKRRGMSPKHATATPATAPASTPPASADEYERCRNERIRENLERMQKLGLVDLSLRVRAGRLSSSTKRGGARKVATSSPSRRSSRLQNLPSVLYDESRKKKMVRTWRSRMLIMEAEVGGRDEVYMEEHYELPGTHEKEWTLFVDGCGRNGRRIYDQINGKTCHQCRQKTLGLHTHCSKCEMITGQFCGGCLFTRYGENILEVKKNPYWICPVCRGICNCSICRKKKGCAPTGAVYRKATSLGFKSVAHYLIQTQHLQPSSKTPDSSCLLSAKRSLTFAELDPSESNKSVQLENVSNLEYSNGNNMENREHNEGDSDDSCISNVTLNLKDMDKENSQANLDFNDSKGIDCKADLQSQISNENASTAKVENKWGKGKDMLTATPSSDCISSQLRKLPNHQTGLDNESMDCKAKNKQEKIKKVTAIPTSDCIASRLRKRTN